MMDVNFIGDFGQCGFGLWGAGTLEMGYLLDEGSQEEGVEDVNEKTLNKEK